MSDHSAYLAFVAAHPGLFVNLPDPDTITILLDEAEITSVEEDMARRLVAKGLPAALAQVGIAYDDQYVMLLRDAVRFPDGLTGTYVRFVDPDDAAPGVVVLPVYRGQVLLVHHFRHASRQWFLELPRGFGMPGLTSEETARHELEQEIGAVESRLVSIGQTCPDTGMMSDRVELFYAEIMSYGEPEKLESIDEVRPVPIPEFERMIRDNEITCGFTLAAYARAHLRGLLQ